MNINLLDSVLLDEKSCWLIKMDERLIGVHSEFGWCVRLGDELVPLNAEAKFVPVGPLLEMPVKELLEFLQQAATKMPEKRHEILSFPKEMLLKHVFHTSYSSYWPEKALAWLSEMPEAWFQFKDELHTFSKNINMSQAARQRAKKIIRKIEEHNNR